MAICLNRDTSMPSLTALSNAPSELGDGSVSVSGPASTANIRVTGPLA